MMNLVGQQLGNYRLIKHLGQGGFTDVYLGQHQYLNTQAAIKVMHSRISQSDLQDFLKEAQTVAALKHPQIVRVLDFGVENNTPFLVMDVAQGTLRQQHPKGSVLSITTVLPYVKQAPTALQYAHDHRRIHRDVKPENMLVEANGDILLSDFGIAVIDHSTSSLVTQRPSGTPYCMAPEMFSGRPEKASDQYSLAIMVYEWLCGTRPFNEGNFIQLGYQHTHEPVPPLHEKVPAISSTVEQVVLRALAKEPEERFANVTEFATALEQTNTLSFPPQAPVVPKFETKINDVTAITTAAIRLEKQFAENGYTGSSSRPSLQLIRGSASMVLSCPHAVKHPRRGHLEVAETYTGPLAIQLASLTHTNALIYARTSEEDPNYDAGGEYKNQLKHLVMESQARFVLDIHGLAREQSMQVVVGTGGDGNNLLGQTGLLNVLSDVLKNAGFTIVIDHPHFAAAGPNTISSFSSRELGIPALQIEVHKDYRDPKQKPHEYAKLLSVLSEAIHAITKLL